MALNIHLDGLIFKLQAHGGISTLWRHLEPELKAALPDCTFDNTLPADLFISSYYALPPIGVRSLVLCYDFIHERHMSIQHPDAVAKRRAIAQADAVIAISQQTARDCKDWTGREATVAYPGADHITRADTDTIETFQRSIGAPYVLVMGRRGLYKNVAALYQAWALTPLSQTHRILAVGGEPLSAYEQGLGVARIDLSDSELAAAYSGAAALVYPSLYEGFGLPIVEAMRCGCPVICAPSMAEVAGDAVFYADVYRPVSIAAALNETLNPSARLQHALLGYERAKAYTWKQMAETIAGVIRGL